MPARKLVCLMLSCERSLGPHQYHNLPGSQSYSVIAVLSVNYYCHLCHGFSGQVAVFILRPSLLNL